MILRLNRFFDNGKSTIGNLFLNDEFLCFTLEDTFRWKKIKNETRIPSGVYEIGLQKKGRLRDKYSLKFPTFHKGMIWIKGILDFSNVYFHIGNTAKNTSGCILVGESVTSSFSKSSKDNIILQSTNCYTRIYGALLKVANDPKGCIVIGGIA